MIETVATKRACPCCGKKRAETLRTMHLADFDGNNPLGDFTVAGCECGFIFNDLFASEEEISAFYHSNTLYPAPMGVGSGGLSSLDIERYCALVAFFSPYCPKSAETRIVDVGCAYGVASLLALKQGAKVIAIDSDIKHLEELNTRAPATLKQNLETIHGNFPDDVVFEDNSISAFLLSRVLHYFDGDTIMKTLMLIYRYLIPGGKVFITTTTPYLRILERFIPLYEQNLATNKEWPGEMRKAQPFCDA